jgi:hypothetical protein
VIMITASPINTVSAASTQIAYPANTSLATLEHAVVDMESVDGVAIVP